MYLFKKEPKSTPNIDEQTRAIEEPNKTANLELDWDEINMVAS